MRFIEKLLPTFCLLCAEKSGSSALCPACERDCPVMPLACPQCAMPSLNGVLCGECRQDPPFLNGASALFRYTFPVNHLITLFKYHAHLSLAQWFAEHLPKPSSPAYLIPIPLTPSRLKSRGFNQSLLVARAMAKISQEWILLENLLKRHPNPQNQTGLNKKERILNMRGAFFVDSLSNLKPLPFILLDDVMTTGATLNEAARTLKNAGVKEVRAHILARRF